MEPQIYGLYVSLKKNGIVFKRKSIKEVFHISKSFYWEKKIEE